MPLRLFSTAIPIRNSSQIASILDNLKSQQVIRKQVADLEGLVAEKEKAQAALRKAHDELENRVRERTAELSQTNAQLTQEIHQRTRIESELQEAKNAAESASRAKSDFLANMSHELRTPMNAVIGFSEMILDGIYGDPPEEIADAVREVQQSGEHLLGLINDVLDISKIEAGRMELKLTECAPEESIDTVLGRMTGLATEKGLALIADLSDELPSCLFDQQRITQVLVNLVGNAIKFTHVGEVRVGASTQEEEIRFWVSDTGIGIPEAELGNIFSEFQQADSSLTRETQGSGLGLAISKRFVEMHGGRIWVQSTVGEGSTFWFTLPVRSNR